MSAAVRADFHENSMSGNGKQSSKLCQDGATSKVISVILGCASKTHSDLQIRSSCLEDVDFPKGNSTFIQKKGPKGAMIFLTLF